MKKIQKKLLFTFLLTCCLWLIHLQFGLMTPYYYFEALQDVNTGKIRLLTYGERVSHPTVIKEVSAKYGFYYTSIAGCVVTPTIQNRARIYNNVMYDYLAKRNGENWRQAYKKKELHEALKLYDSLSTQ